jgi:hypothetical protein
VKAALIGLVLTVAGPARLHITIFAAPASIPVAWLILLAEVIAVGVLLRLALPVLCRFRSAPWPRFTGPAGAMP